MKLFKISRIFLILVLLKMSYVNINALASASATSKNTKEQELYDAVAKNDLQRAEQLLKEGAHIQIVKKQFEIERTPLHLAVYSKNILMIDLFLKSIQKSEVDARSGYGETPLHYACLEKLSLGEFGFECVKRLIEAGADVNARNCNGSTPLHYCGSGLTAEALELLINAKADIFAINKYGENILHEVVCYGDINIIKKLIDLKVPVNTVSRSGSPFDMVVKALFFTHNFYEFVNERDRAVVEVLIKAGALVKQKYVNHLSQIGISVPEGQILASVKKIRTATDEIGKIFSCIAHRVFGDWIE